MKNGDSKRDRPNRSTTEEFEGTFGEGDNDINPAACFTGNEASTEQDSTIEQSYDVETLRIHLESECVIPGNGAANNGESCDSQPSMRYDSELTSERPQTNAVQDDEMLELPRLPSPPSASPNVEDNEDDCAPALSDNVDSITSNSSLSDIYTWNLTGSNLPSPLILRGDEERLIWPLEEEFSIRNGQFKETVHYDLDILLGEGAFGNCYLANKVPDPADGTDEGRVFCVKKCQYRPNELLALHLAKKENIKEIVDFYGAKLQGRNACIFMEFMAGGTIAELLIERQRDAQPWPVIEEKFCYGCLEDVLKALEFLHSKGIVHRDIKGNNLLLDEYRNRVKLADFGSAENANVAQRSDDIWKTGCLLLEMLNGERTPLLGVNDGGLRRQNSCRPEDHIPPKAEEVTKHLLRLFFGIDTEDREYLPTATEILKKSNAFAVTKQCSETSQ